jgi:hypothetical protein
MLESDEFQEPNPFALDLTHGFGLMPVELKLAHGFTKLDVRGVRRPHVRADFRYVPFRSGQFRLVLYDPPHLTDFGTEANKEKHGRHPIVERYSAFRDVADLRKSCYLAFREIARILAPQGVLIFKWNEYIKKIDWVLRLVPFELVETRRVLAGQRRNETRHQRTFFIYFKRVVSVE